MKGPRPGRIPLSTLSAALAIGTCCIGALLAFQYSAEPAVDPDQAKTLLYAFLLAALFVAASLLFAKGEAQRKEAA